MELSGGDPYVHNVHTEGYTTGFQLGDLSGTNSATLTNIRPDNKTTNGVVISNQYQTSGGLPGILPTENVNIFNLDATGGTPAVTDSLIDQINNNTLTVTNNGTVSSYVFGPSGVFTTAKPESGLLNAVDISGQSIQVFNNSSTASLTAGPGSVNTGSITTVCAPGTAGAYCAKEGTIFANATGAAGFYPDSTQHEFMAATNGSSNAGILVRAQPQSISVTGQHAAIGTSTLCPAAAGACNVTGQYHVHWNFWGKQYRLR